MALLSILTSALTVQVVNAMDVDFFSGNDILYYDPDACKLENQNGDIAVQGNDNAEKVFRFLISTSFKGFNNKPFNALQAAGALGNFEQESSMNPADVEQDAANYGEGHGLAQWSFGRKDTLFKLASSMGKQWSDLTVQLKMIQNELDGDYGKKLLDQNFDKVTTPTDASWIFQKVYEVADSAAANQPRRNSAAEAYYKEFKSLAPGDITAGAGCNNPATSGFVVYNQYDPKWKDDRFGDSTVGESGCGPSAMAMAITALTGKQITPADTSAYANTDLSQTWDGSGSKWSIAPFLAEHWGLKAANISNTVEAVNTALKAGGMVVTSGQGAVPFTSGGHYIIIHGIAPDGKWLIGDSNGPPPDGEPGATDSHKEWDPQYILNIANAGNVVAITK